jgi:hypothetical protein
MTDTIVSLQQYASHLGDLDDEHRRRKLKQALFVIAGELKKLRGENPLTIFDPTKITLKSLDGLPFRATVEEKEKGDEAPRQHNNEQHEDDEQRARRKEKEMLDAERVFVVMTFVYLQSQDVYERLSGADKTIRTLEAMQETWMRVRLETGLTAAATLLVDRLLFVTTETSGATLETFGCDNTVFDRPRAPQQQQQQQQRQRPRKGTSEILQWMRRVDRRTVAKLAAFSLVALSLILAVAAISKSRNCSFQVQAVRNQFIDELLAKQEKIIEHQTQLGLLRKKWHEEMSRHKQLEESVAETNRRAQQLEHELDILRAREHEAKDIWILEEQNRVCEAAVIAERNARVAVEKELKILRENPGACMRHMLNGLSKDRFKTAQVLEFLKSKGADTVNFLKKAGKESMSALFEAFEHMIENPNEAALQDKLEQCKAHVDSLNGKLHTVRYDYDACANELFRLRSECR